MLLECSLRALADGVLLVAALTQSVPLRMRAQLSFALLLKAYAKRTGEPADVSRVARVEIDEEMLGDHSIAASVVLLARETVSAEIFLRPIEVQAALPALTSRLFRPINPATSTRPSRRLPPLQSSTLRMRTVRMWETKLAPGGMLVRF